MSARRFVASCLALSFAAIAVLALPGRARAAQGSLVSACGGTIGCPNKINLKNPVDSLQFYALLAPASALDPPAEAFSLTLRNANGVVFTETIGAGQLRKQGRRFQFRDPNARKVGGFSRVTLKRKGAGWRLTVIAHGDMSAATLAPMTVEIAIGDDTFATANTWSPREFGWLLHLPAGPTPPPTPTAAPTGTPAPTQTPAPTPSGTPATTPTPVGTPTSSPATPTPTPAPTPAPTQTPTPTPTVEPYGSVSEAFFRAPRSLLR